MLSTELFLLLVFLAIGIGFLASLFGIGGGFLLVPTMILLVGLDTHLTVGTVSLVITFMAISSTIAYARQKRIDFKVSGMLMVASIIGSVIGAQASALVSGQFILILFGTVEAILALILGFKKTPAEKLQQKASQNTDSKDAVEAESVAKSEKWWILDRYLIDSDGNEYFYRSNLLVAFPFCLLAGFLSSLLGIGGGTLYIQIFVFACGMPIHLAIASSMFTILISGMSSAITFAYMGQIDYVVAIAYSIGIVLGAQLGAMVNKKMDAKHLKPLAALMIVIIALRMIYFAVVGN